ncbi:hypothetical protein PIB30_063298 [Stylosanthes scabra]|uniref:Putative plant transposon protein domain-containing protein n=1 Tax=Stylosanthes scabra TaxID=79078 RepID=A0ABU6YNZ7_9FABA|nr:hypothetical protein [Stylosanthes scabra]
MVREFYANAWEPEKEKRKPFTYKTMVRGKEISFAPQDIKRVLRLRNDPLPNAASYEERVANKDYRLDNVQEDLCIKDGEWVRHKDGRPHYLRRADLEPMTKGWYDFVCRSVMPTTNHSELTVERVVLIHSIIIGENINVEEIIAKQFYKFIYKTDLASSLPFPSIIAALCADAKVPAIKNDNMIPQEPTIVGAAMLRTRETRARQARQEAPPPQQPPQVHPQRQVHQQQEIPSSFYTHFDASMSQIYRRLDQQQEESRRSFDGINTRMDRMDDQLSFLCYSNQMVNETMYYPYQNTAREENKGKAREVVPDSVEEGSEELYSSESEEWKPSAASKKSTHQVQLSKEDKDERNQSEEAKARIKKLKGLRSSPPHVKKKRKDPAKKKVKIRKPGEDNSKEKKEEEEEKRRLELKCKSVEDLIGKLYTFKKVLHHNDVMTHHLVKDQSKWK